MGRDQLQGEAFNPAVPYKLPFDAKHIPSACSNWFLHDANPAFDLSQSRPKATELRNAFWSEHEDTVVPLELTLTPPGKNHSSAYATFHRSEGPLKILLAFLAEPYYASTARLGQQRSIYLAQCPLSTLPDSMQADLPTPEIVSKAGKGDIYDSSLWLGRPPTYTPLHRDPNPNFFLQLAGAKVIRLFPPQVGDAMFGAAQEILQNKDGSAAFRGEEMMRGKNESCSTILCGRLMRSGKVQLRSMDKKLRSVWVRHSSSRRDGGIVLSQWRALEVSTAPVTSGSGDVKPDYREPCFVQTAKEGREAMRTNMCQPSGPVWSPFEHQAMRTFHEVLRATRFSITTAFYITVRTSLYLRARSSSRNIYCCSVRSQPL